MIVNMGVSVNFSGVVKRKNMGIHMVINLMRYYTYFYDTSYRNKCMGFILFKYYFLVNIRVVL